MTARQFPATRFQDTLCPYCWEPIVAFSPIIESYEPIPIWPDVPATFASFQGCDRIVGMQLLPCGHSVHGWMWWDVNLHTMALALTP